MSVEKRYLGDGVYVELNGWMITLTTNPTPQLTGKATNTIHLEPGVWHALKQYVETVEKERR